MTGTVRSGVRELVNLTFPDQEHVTLSITIPMPSAPTDIEASLKGKTIREVLPELEAAASAIVFEMIYPRK